MIRCCYGCPAREITCHTWCIHYLNEKALLEQQNEERKRQYAGKYYQTDSARVNRHTREALRKK